jgi:hypothetical protein
MLNNEIPFELKTLEDFFENLGIKTEEIIITDDDDVSNDPFLTIYQSIEGKSYGVIYLWRTKDLVLEVIDWDTGDQVYNEHTKIDFNFDFKILIPYINHMTGLVSL